MAGKLVLGMQEGNWVQVGESIIMLEEICGNRIRISIQAPKHIRVLRDRVVEKQRKKDAGMPEVRKTDG
jgi:sRNA-binding carbon storage regulator CsrA